MNNHTVLRRENQAMQAHETPPRRNGIAQSAFYPRRPLFSVTKPYSFKIFLRAKPWHSLPSPATGFAAIWRLRVFCPPFKQKKEPQFCGSFEIILIACDLTL